MPISVCPSDIVHAPLEDVWELLSQPSKYGSWVDAQFERDIPSGQAIDGQQLPATTRAFGRQWSVTVLVEHIDEARHRMQFSVALPLGIISHNTLTCTRVDDVTSNVQFG